MSAQAVEIACAAVANAQKTKGHQFAYDIAVAYACGYAVALRQLLGPEAAADRLYQIADQIATTPHGGVG